MKQCPVCRHSDVREATALAGHRRFVCRRCGHQHIAPPPTEQLLATYGHDYAGFRTDSRFRRRVLELWTESVAPHAPQEVRTVLDVGCGGAEFLDLAAEMGLTARGFDLSEASAEKCRERGLAADAGDFLEYDFRTQFDVITSWDVLEHLPAPLAFVERAAALLTPGGLVVAKVPLTTQRSLLMGSLHPKVARALLHTPSHVQYFTLATARLLVSTAELDPLEARCIGGIRTVRSDGSWRQRAKRAVRRHLARSSGLANAFVVARGKP
ncbi:MAG TPA: class I SAM-dependent methyltransferase [Polyangiaceae bacterium LLY-WYZ-15_(1-7)]|mgnify:CR=1 FL=1|nr:hypothetical protein [Sandaracinus sp.]HJK93017.1 class I SAM-dependent methyltransferase [Polyangiaceae bacterium LLY-WYZ-15_(1-7)]MBJ75254.1 hypothetical protein [Sandaracinus sp.]HJL06144.1 class I SAM-dependent methyltransferase [Polyangiaceae bacterium LLY-WYZ-15_(1-7)]HJL11807.1 class I SAM-dependent methyltransferase [Polyangiaceae bacterium LLY-WYZ-15_(1-7)]